MRARAAHIKVMDGSAIVGPSGYGAKKKELLERKLALKNIALGEAEFALEVERGQDLAADDDVFDVGRVFGDGVDDIFAEGFLMIVPRAFGKFVRRVLHEAGEHVFAGRGDAGIRDTGDDYVDVGPARKVAVLGVVVSALHVVHAGRNGNCAAKMRAGGGETFEIGKRVEREIDFAGGAAKFVAADAFEKIGWQFAGIEKFLEGDMGVDAGRNDVGD